MSNCCWGRECKLGWGYNEDMSLFIPVEEEPPDVISETGDDWGNCSPSAFSLTDIPYWVSF